MYLGKYAFPTPSDCDLEYVSKVIPEAVSDLLQHFQLCSEKAMNPVTVQEKSHRAHLDSLMQATRKRADELAESYH